MTNFNDPGKEEFSQHYGKGENADNQHFLLFPQCFLFCQRKIAPFEPPFNFRLQMVSIWTSLKYCRW